MYMYTYTLNCIPNFCIPNLLSNALHSVINGKYKYSQSILDIRKCSHTSGGKRRERESDKERVREQERGRERERERESTVVERTER